MRTIQIKPLGYKMKKKGYFLFFQNVLKNFGLQTQIIEESDHRESLQCTLGNDKKHRALILSITIIETSLHPPDSMGYLLKTELMPLKENASELLIQLFIPLPFKALQKNYGDTARELMRINKTMLFPGFGLEEENGMIFYRNTFLRPNGILNKNQFISIIGMITLLIDTFSEEIEIIATA